MAKSFTKTAYTNLNDLVYGTALYPVKLKNGMSIGGGTLYPEVNFTLPPMDVSKDTMKEVHAQYKEMITGICTRAKELYSPGFVAEIESVPQCTQNPEWDAEVCKIVADTIKEFDAKYGVKGAVRCTPADIREWSANEHMYKGKQWDNLFKAFEGCAKAGADFLAIESIGGKEVHDEAIMYCDIEKSIVALSVLGAPDVFKVWSEIVRIAEANGCTAAGDTACGFANTALALAEKDYIPRVFAAAVRVMCAARNISAYEAGAKGPHKDCGYEGIYLKCITGTPITNEGRSATCAHSSSIGNVAACCSDLWSNESVTNIKLLGGMAPTQTFETLVYDCRLMNTAAARGKDTAILLRDILADSDSKLDPQAYVLRPDVAFNISQEIVKEEGYYNRIKKAAECAFSYMQKAVDKGDLLINDKEKTYLSNLADGVAKMPKDVGEIQERVLSDCEAFDPKKYDM